jgi:type I restriction enzyme S subunit
MAGEWAPIRLGDVCTKIGSGATPRGGSEVYFQEGPYALIRSQNVYNDGFHHDGLAFIDEKHAAEIENVEVLEGDVLLNITGDSVARSCQVDPGILPARVNQHVAIIRPDPSQLAPRFLRYVLVSPEMQARLLSWAGSGGTRNALTKGMIESLEVLAPADIAEQRAIAHILGTLDDKIELNRRMSETLEAIARALFKSWFVRFDPVRRNMARKGHGQPSPGASRHPLATGEGSVAEGQHSNALPLGEGQGEGVIEGTALDHLFPARLVDSELGKIPEGWEVGTLGDFSALNPEVWTRQTRPPEIKYVDLSNTKWGRIELVTTHQASDTPSRAQRVLRAGDTIVGTVRPGNGSYALISEPGLTGSTGFAVLRPTGARYAKFVYLAATAADNIDTLAHLADGAAYPAVRPEVVAATPIVRPTDEVLGRFSGVAGPLLAKIAHSDRESRTLAALRDALLPKLISGELRVKDAERFLANASL